MCSIRPLTQPSAGIPVMLFGNGSPHYSFGKFCDDLSQADSTLFEEWNQLSQTKYELQWELEQVEDTIYNKYPDARIARSIQQDVHKLSSKMPLAKRLKLMRSRESADQLIRKIDREVFSARDAMKRQLQSTEEMLIAIEQQLEILRKNAIEAVTEKNNRMTRWNA